MASAARASASRHSRRPSHINVMTNSGQGNSIFASLPSEGEEEEEIDRGAADLINGFYSPIEQEQQQIPNMVEDGVPRDLVVPNNDHPVETQLRKKCAFFFMDPVQKFIARRQAPWKLILQFAKIFLITAQILIFGQFRYAHTNYYKDNHIAFEHLFMRNWDAAREIHAYPPATGQYALYKKESFYAFFNYTADTFSRLNELTLAPTLPNSTLDFCVESYIPLKGDGINDLFVIHGDEKQLKCLSLANDTLNNFNSHTYLVQHDFDVPWTLLIQMKMNFSVNTITSRQLGPVKGQECFKFHIDILFDNRDHDGQIPIELISTPKRYNCPTIVEAASKDTEETNSIRVLSVVVGLTCLTSFILCCRALIRGQILAKETATFFLARYNISLTLMEKAQFLNLWYVIICINDILIIIGTILKEIIENRRTDSDLWDMCSACLGVGNLLVWMGMLRYLGFFEKYNVIIITIRQAMPNIVRFTVCVSIMYFGFVFCGWVVLGPYQFKFNTLSSTSECLFSLINGDDMFATFSMVSAKNGMIWSFSRLYLYLFVIIFIYVVLSLFIAIITDAYELVKEHYRVGFPRTRVDAFYLATDYDVYSKAFCQGTRPSLLYICWAWIMKKWFGPSWPGYTRETSQPQSDNEDQLIT